MKSVKRSPGAILKSLRRNQRKHETMLGRVEKAATRLERRRLKLHALEARIADLERRMADPHRNGNGPSRGGVLEPARLIFNPTSGRDHEDNAARLSEIVQSLRAHGIDAQISLKTSGKAARALAREAVRSGHPLVVVAAGDGTIEEVASELVGSTTTLGIVPIGTNNNLARSLGVPLDIDDACALIAMGTTRHIDAGRVVSSESLDVEYFLEGAGVGLSAIAALAGQALEKRRWRLMPSALRRFFEAAPGTIRVEMDGTAIEASSHIVTVSNAPLMGNNLLIAPDAKMDDGWLDVTIYDGMGNASLIRHFMTASGGKSDRLKAYRARHVRITSQEPVPANSDKDAAGQQRVIEIEIVPKALSVIVGNGIGLSLPMESAPRAVISVAELASHTNGSAEAAIAGPVQPGP
jgi:YegS/Rv2252/BmrU family lipid kinase